MPIVAAKTIYEHARTGGYAVGGFAAEHMDMVKAIIQAAEETRSPVIVFLWEADIQSAGEGCLETLVKHAAARASVPVAIMLDHGSTVDFCLRCIVNGHSGVMIDGSHLPLAENIALSRKLAEICHMVDVIVEGEVGTVRRTFESSGAYAAKTVLTDPDEAAQYVKESQVDSLAISIGTQSGVYKETPKLDFTRLRQIRERTDAYLVLHGGSGTPADQIRAAVEGGVSGVRFATELRLAFFNTLEAKRRELGLENPDSRLMLGPARAAAKELAKQRMEQLRCVNRSWLAGPACSPCACAQARTQVQPPYTEAQTEEIVRLVTHVLARTLALR